MPSIQPPLSLHDCSPRLPAPLPPLPADHYPSPVPRCVHVVALLFYMLHAAALWGEHKSCSALFAVVTQVSFRPARPMESLIQLGKTGGQLCHVCMLKQGCGLLA